MLDLYMKQSLTKIATRKLPLTICLIVGLSLLGASPTEADPGALDSVLVLSTVFEKGDPATIEIWTLTDEWLTGIEITLTWDWPELIVDSFSFSPSRFILATIKGYAPHSNNLTIFAFPTGAGLIAPGRLLLGTIYFNYPDTALAQTAIIDTTTLYLNDSFLVRSNMFTDSTWVGSFIPQFQTAELTMTSCCVGFTGNTNCDVEDKVNLADITRLIDRIYLSKTVLCCEAAGNVNGDIEQKLNLADITRLIDHVYLSKQPTAPCL